MHFKSLTEFAKFIALSLEDLATLGGDAESDFALKVPKHFAEKIQKNNPHDPLLLQVLPRKIEKQITVGFTQDPVGDLQANPTPALLHKYHGRALLMTSPRCDIHCRFCFRRHFPYEHQIKQAHWQTALQQVAQDPSLKELILSGGDPMTLSEPQLVHLCQQIEQIETLQTLRIHSRTPIVAPDKAPSHHWLTFCENTRLKVVLVVHCNHPQELSAQTAALFRRYRQAGITLLNQSVLLKNVNDNASTLEQLSHALFQQDILPYYLHQLDKVQGAAHFEVSDEQALSLMQELRQRLPGYLVPKLVREIAGTAYKVPVDSHLTC